MWWYASSCANRLLLVCRLCESETWLLDVVSSSWRQRVDRCYGMCPLRNAAVSRIRKPIFLLVIIIWRTDGSSTHKISTLMEVRHYLRPPWDWTACPDKRPSLSANFFEFRLRNCCLRDNTRLDLFATTFWSLIWRLCHNRSVTSVTSRWHHQYVCPRDVPGYRWTRIPEKPCIIIFSRFVLRSDILGEIGHFVTANYMLPARRLEAPYVKQPFSGLFRFALSGSKDLTLIWVCSTFFAQISCPCGITSRSVLTVDVDESFGITVMFQYPRREICHLNIRGEQFCLLVSYATGAKFE